MEPMAEPGILIFKHIIFKVLGSRAGDLAGAKIAATLSTVNCYRWHTNSWL
jgi:hypothetical protein